MYPCSFAGLDGVLDLLPYEMPSEDNGPASTAEGTWLLAYAGVDGIRARITLVIPQGDTAEPLRTLGPAAAFDYDGDGDDELVVPMGDEQTDIELDERRGRSVARTTRVIRRRRRLRSSWGSRRCESV